jgi:hypothetical protein
MGFTQGGQGKKGWHFHGAKLLMFSPTNYGNVYGPMKIAKSKLRWVCVKLKWFA